MPGNKKRPCGRENKDTVCIRARDMRLGKREPIDGMEGGEETGFLWEREEGSELADTSKCNNARRKKAQERLLCLDHWPTSAGSRRYLRTSKR